MTINALKIDVIQNDGFTEIYTCNPKSTLSIELNFSMHSNFRWFLVASFYFYAFHFIFRIVVVNK